MHQFCDMGVMDGMRHSQCLGDGFDSRISLQFTRCPFLQQLPKGKVIHIENEKPVGFKPRQARKGWASRHFRTESKEPRFQETTRPVAGLGEVYGVSPYGATTWACGLRRKAQSLGREPRPLQVRVLSCPPLYVL